MVGAVVAALLPSRGRRAFTGVLEPPHFHPSELELKSMKKKLVVK
jgi:hypothetical protein